MTTAIERPSTARRAVAPGARIPVPGSRNTAIDAARFVSRLARTPRRRTMREFAEQEFVLPSGPYEGQRFRCDRQPFTAAWFHAIDYADMYGFNRFAATGPTQASKTTIAFHIPVLYHLFEIGERVIIGLPDEDMASDKWFMDLRPVIERTKYRDMLPTVGGGSRGGKVHLIQFKNGGALKFMTAGGGDKSRAHYTARVVVITEADGMDTATSGSREADPVSQIEARTSAYKEMKRIYLECTTSIEQGRIWQERLAGTCSGLALPCPHCKGWCVPKGDESERKLLIGWEGADNELDARERARFACSVCGEAWSEDQRREANRRFVLVHKGQAVENGEDGQPRVVGDAPRTMTFALRWSAINNFFKAAADVGQAEWKARREVNEENALKKLLQFEYALPHKPDATDLTPLDEQAICKRTLNIPKGVVPKWAHWVIETIDLGKYVGWRMVKAWHADGRSHVVDYGPFDIHTRIFGEERATEHALAEIKAEADKGWKIEGQEDGGEMHRADVVWIDSNYEKTQEMVYALCRTDPRRIFSTLGRGSSQYNGTNYVRPTDVSKSVVAIGEQFHFVSDAAIGLIRVLIDADYWKQFARERLSVPVDGTAPTTLYEVGSWHQHMLLARHLTAEKPVEEFKAGVGGGTRIRWDKVRSQNHLLDCDYINCAAASWCGMRVVKAETPKRQNAETREGMKMPDGRPYLITERE